ncbi:nitrilase [Maritalea myrionectae]|uniref:Nitrilase n=1 Tax=Maritalea myrionectae TaxID=454601 RepID=A0A2R4MHN4_9HYPH|nr:carbon-nitrogen hydrolase family protein [Maritalea myrionectae]AVX05480.1 nitrilase [Maritalea myrionectae]
MGRSHPKYIAGAVQAASVVHDLEGGVRRTIELIEEASEKGVKVLVFPETWIPGYPYWAWLGPQAWGMQFVQAYHDNAMEVGDEHHQAICAAARAHNMYVVLGFAEKFEGSVYIAQSIIGPDGVVIANRRKLKATHVERAVFGEGSGVDLDVHRTEDAGNLGALCCWEHMQPLSKYALYSMNEQVHAAAWPTLSLYEGKAFALGPEANMSLSRTYAMEGQCFVIAATSVMTSEIQDALGLDDMQKDLLPVGGGSSSIFAPDGQLISAPLPPDEEGIVVAELDLGLISLAKAAADPAGHYARPDVTQLVLNRAPTPTTLVRAPERPSGPTAFEFREDDVALDEEEMV